MPTTDLDITEDEQTKPLALQDLNKNTSELLDKPTHLRDFISQYKSKQNFICTQKHVDKEFEVTHKNFLFSSKQLKLFFFLSKHSWV